MLLMRFQPTFSQLQLYGCNILNLGNSRIIAVHADSARQIVRDQHFTGDVQVIDYSPITSMYGAVHCSSQVVKRVPRRCEQQGGQHALRKYPSTSSKLASRFLAERGSVAINPSS